MISYPLNVGSSKAANAAGSIVILPLAITAIGCIAAGLYAADLLSRSRHAKSKREQRTLETNAVLLSK